MTGTATLMDSYTEMTELLLPNETNDLGRALGGVVMHWMDLCGVVAAMRFAGTQCVTAATDRVDFRNPIALGEVAVVEAYVFETGDTSLEVRVEVESEDPTDGERTRATTSFFTYVAVDDEGRPTPVPDLAAPTETERSLREAAVECRRDQLAEVAAKLEE